MNIISLCIGRYEHNVPWDIMNIMFSLEGNYEHNLPIQREIMKNFGKSEVCYFCKNRVKLITYLFTMIYSVKLAV